MNIGGIPHQAFPSIGYAISASSNGRTSLPVDPSLVIYSQLKHISGTPAPEGTQGVNINKLRILDTLIEQLAKAKNRPSVEFGNLDGSNEQRINAMIEHLQKQLKTAQNVAFYTPAAPAVGTLVDISV